MAMTLEQLGAIMAAGEDLVVWLDFFANVCPDTKVGAYADESRKAIARWEALVPVAEDR